MKINLGIPGSFCAGLGDCVLWAWIANGPEPLEFWAVGKNREMLELLGCRLLDSPDGAINPNDAYNVEKAEGCRRPRVEIWAEWLGIPCEPKRPVLKMEERSFMRRRVALCPHTHFRSRAWHNAYWQDVNWSLRGLNIEPIWIWETKDDELLSNGGPTMAYWGFGLKQVAEMLASCAVVVGVDSMPAHLAGTIGRPTIAIMGPTQPAVFSHIQNVLPMQAEGLDCTGCHFQRPFRAACDLACQSMLRVYPQDVSRTVSHIVETLSNGPRTTSSSVSSENEAAAGVERGGSSRDVVRVDGSSV